MSSSHPIAKPKHVRFRIGAFVFAFVLGCQAIWLLAAEISRRPLLGLSAITEADADRNAAALAASIGFIRGDLWADYALAYFDPFKRYGSDEKSVLAPDALITARYAADRALSLAPHDARIWLVLAGIDSRSDWLNHNRAEDLRMSYYTGANESPLIPARLLFAAGSQAMADKDFQDLVRHDIRTIVTRKPELKSAILAAYQDAFPSGQQFIEQTLLEIDPELVVKLHSKQ